MAKTTSIIVPYGYMARGLVDRQRQERLHAAIGVFEARVPVLEREGSVVLRYRGTRMDLPVVGGRIARPCPLDPLAHDPWEDEARFLDGNGTEEAVEAFLARVEDDYSHDIGDFAGRWAHAPVPIRDLRPSSDGRIVREGALRSVTASDREERLAEARTASSGLAVVDGLLCVFGDEPVFPAYIATWSEDGGGIFVDAPVFLGDALHGVRTSRRGMPNHDMMVPYLRPDEAAALAASGTCRGSFFGSREWGLDVDATGDLASVRWSTRSELLSAACLGSAVGDIAFGRHSADFRRPPPAVEAAAAALLAASLAHADGASGEALPDLADDLARAARGTSEIRRNEATKAIEAAVHVHETLADAVRLVHGAEPSDDARLLEL